MSETDTYHFFKLIINLSTHTRLNAYSSVTEPEDSPGFPILLTTVRRTSPKWQGEVA